MGLKDASGRNLLPLVFGHLVAFDVLEEISTEEQHERTVLLAFEKYFSCINPSFSRRLATESDFGLQSSMMHNSVSFILLYHFYF